MEIPTPPFRQNIHFGFADFSLLIYIFFQATLYRRVARTLFGRCLGSVALIMKRAQKALRLFGVRWLIAYWWRGAERALGPGTVGHGRPTVGHTVGHTQ